MLSRAAALESGKQAVKTAIAGAISLAITNLFHLPEGYWAAISALIVMQSNVGATLNASRTRLAGTAIGAIVGGIFVAIFGMNMLRSEEHTSELQSHVNLVCRLLLE